MSLKHFSQRLWSQRHLGSNPSPQHTDRQPNSFEPAFLTCKMELVTLPTMGGIVRMNDEIMHVNCPAKPREGVRNAFSNQILKEELEIQ